MRPCLKALPMLLFLTLAAQIRSQQTANKPVEFRTDIEPILAKNCQSCHNGGAAPADLRLDSPAAILQGSITGKVIVPGKAAESLLVQRISSKTGVGMPPSGPLSDDQIALITAWINQGAKIDDAPVSDLFTTAVLPIFRSSCYQCHSGNQPKGQLHLDVKSLALKGGVSGPVIIPGDSGSSRLLQRVLGAGGESQMPLKGASLTKEQIAVLRRWIDEGAKWPDTVRAEQAPETKHWAYVKPVRPELPTVKDAAWGRNSIDRFVLARLEKEGLKPSPEASKETLIRRVSLDLTGLPPTPAEVDAFVGDSHSDAYERLVDRLLASPHYGERWATPWLDLARYGDSDGLRDDRQRVAWPYRDWVIQALNRNMPFDQFTIEQLAGDLLPGASVEQKVATGFVRSSTLQTENGTDPEENNWNAQVDRASTVGSVWLGSTLGCAQCHNHKYDPFTQKQFYQMVAFFNNGSFVKQAPKKGSELVAFGDVGKFTEPRLDLPSTEQARKRDEINAQIKQYEAKLNDSSPEFQKRQAAWESALLSFEDQWQPLRASRLSSQNGTTLTAMADASILASGKNPDSDTYEFEAKAPLRGITALRIEALPDASLPAGGPGRDYYGNFMLHEVKVDVESEGRLASTVAFKEILPDEIMPKIVDPQIKMKQIWIVDATGQAGTYDELKVTGAAGRVKSQLLLIPDKPLKTDAGGLLRITLIQTSEINGVNLGRFRVSATTAGNPKFMLDVPAGLRPLLSIPSEKRTPQQAAAVTAQYRTVAVELAPVRDKIAELRAEIQALKIPSTLIVAEDQTVAHPSTYVRMRGAFVSKGDLVEADVPGFLGPLPAGAPSNRLGLARWLVSRENPLTARVTVNHFWEAMFGRGIVETPEDFGTQGFPPSHPELLDWLAVEFMDSGWNMKAIQRLIVTSSTYRQSSAVTPGLLERDPGNMLLARGPRFRVEAEMVRDIALTASGLLSEKMFGPPVKPYQPEGLWSSIPVGQGDAQIWEVSAGEDRYRRGVYTYIRRSVRYPSLTVFDAPSREICIARRSHSDTPLQALTTLNDPAFFEAAQAMARRILKEGGANESSRAIYGFRLATSRRPSAQELDTLLSGFGKDQQYFRRNSKEAEAIAGQPDAELAAWTMFSNALLNLDEAITKK
jgi:mono/diheme cytochrome c family protein